MDSDDYGDEDDMDDYKGVPKEMKIEDELHVMARMDYCWFRVNRWEDRDCLVMMMSIIQ